MNLSKAFADAASLFTDPSTLFRGIPPKGPLWLPTLRILFWGLIAGVGGALLDEPVLIVLLPVLSLAICALITPVYHGMVLASGGLGTMRTSYYILSTFSPLLILDVALGGMLLFRIPLLVYKFYLAARAAEEVHAALPKRAYCVFSAALAVLIVLNVRSG